MCVMRIVCARPHRQTHTEGKVLIQESMVIDYGDAGQAFVQLYAGSID